MKTLLIDDDFFALRLLALQLQKLGCTEVIECEHAQDAMAILQSEHIELVFCDLQMPDLDGVEYVRYLARSGYAGSLVLVSGEDERLLQTVNKLALAHSIHMLGAIQKPVAMEQLKQILELHKATRTRPHRPTPALLQAEELKRAMDCKELVIHYQPKVDLGTGEFLGVEALVRWQPPHKPLVFPDQFITTAEDHGLVDELTRIVLEEAFSQSRWWHDNGLDLQVAVNVSMVTLASLDFPDMVAALAEKAGVALSTVVLEVTESKLMRDPRTPLDILTRLRLKRIGLSIDDFGTGHSSLAQLRDIPFNELKLDRSFINGASMDSALGAIVEGTLSMAHHLGMKSVAEGVQDRTDWDFLRDHGCDVAQGYFIARPMPGSEVMRWHAGWARRRQELTSPPN